MEPLSSIHPAIWAALEQACEQAERFRGATAPNPPVGAAALDENGKILAVGAHEKAGGPHAEAQLIRDCAERGLLEKIHTLLVTLEPCNHHGRTPPCTEALLRLPNLKQVLFAVADPNPRAQGGAERLSSAGIAVADLSKMFPDDARVERARELTRPFFHWVKTGRPWVTVKTAHLLRDDEETMIPPPGQKTFTTPPSLRLAHELRKRADAIVTGSGTVLADQPSFTVRHVSDHAEKRRWLVVMDRRGRIPAAWLQGKKTQGFEAIRGEDLESVLDFLGEQGVLEVLVEAGPALSSEVLEGNLWNEYFRITSDGSADEIKRKRANDVHWDY